MRLLLACIAWLCLACLPAAAATASGVKERLETRSPIVTAANQIDPSKLLVRPKRAVPSFGADPMGWLTYQQRRFTEHMQRTLRQIRSGNGWTAGWTLMLLSFLYGIFHAAGPGHGKAVVSAWLLANERQLKRGVFIAFMAAMVQAVTAVVLVSTLLLAVQTVGTTARSMAGLLEAASYALIAALGLYLLWQAFRPLRLVPATAGGAGGHEGHHHNHHQHHHEGSCGCGHAHMPGARDVTGNWSLTKAFSLAFAVGIRPCSGAILALLASSALGIYWAGIASTFAMAVGVAITVSVIAGLAVTSRDMALRLAGDNTRWLDRTAFGLKLAAGVFIAGLGSVLFWNALTNPTPLV